MTKENFSKIQEAGGILCAYCLGEDCSGCMVQNLIERAGKDANIDLMGKYDDDEPAIEVCEHETAERFFVYDKDDNCVSDGFRFEDDAIAFANKTKNPVVKVHTYFIDSDRGGKLYPDGEPTITWKDGRPV